MSTDQPRTPEDRALARRYHFLGLPSEKSNPGVSFAGLRNELGDDNAGALVTRIGVLAKVHNLDQLGIPLHHAVDRILQSLTADERRAISQGGAIPSRVEAAIRAEGEAAKLQMAQLGKSPPGGPAASGPPAGGGWQLVNGQWVQGGPKGNASLAGGDRSNAPASSSRYDSIGTTRPPADGNWNSPAGQSYMSGFAKVSGVPWASGSGYSDLRSLGPAAVKSLGDVHMTKGSYDGLIHDAAFRPRDAVTLANFSKLKGVDSNKLSGDFKAVGKQISHPDMIELNGGLVPYMADPNNPELKKKANEHIDNAETKNPHAAPSLEQLRKDLQLEQGKEHDLKAGAGAEKARSNEKEAAADVKTARADVKQAAVGDKAASLKSDFASLNEPAQPKSETAPKQQAPMQKEAKLQESKKPETKVQDSKSEAGAEKSGQSKTASAKAPTPKLS